MLGCLDRDNPTVVGPGLADCIGEWLYLGIILARLIHTEAPNIPSFGSEVLNRLKLGADYLNKVWEDYRKSMLVLYQASFTLLTCRSVICEMATGQHHPDIMHPHDELNKNYSPYYWYGG